MPFDLFKKRNIAKYSRWLFCAVIALILMPVWCSRADPGDALDTGGSGINVRFLEHAETAAEHGRLSEAIAYCDRVIAQHPDFMAMRFARGRILMEEGLYDAAIVGFSAVLAAYPEYFTLYVYRGIARLHQRKPEMAIPDFNHGMIAKTGIDSLNAANMFISRSFAFELLGRDNDAIADFRDGMRAMYGEEYDWVALTLGCTTAAEIGLLDSAALICDEAIKRHSRNFYAYESRGLANLKAGSFDKAIADYTQSLYWQVDQSLSLYGRGAAKHARGDRAGGDADLVAAAQYEPHIAEIMLRLGVGPNGVVKPAK